MLQPEPLDCALMRREFNINADSVVRNPKIRKTSENKRGLPRLLFHHILVRFYPVGAMPSQDFSPADCESISIVSV
jgi:hypothetical protein